MATGSENDPSGTRNIKGKERERQQKQAGTKRKEGQMAGASEDNAKHTLEGRRNGRKVPEANRQKKHREGKGKGRHIQRKGMGAGNKEHNRSILEDERAGDANRYHGARERSHRQPRNFRDIVRQKLQALSKHPWGVWESIDRWVP
jgi:hypothetical protein